MKYLLLSFFVFSLLSCGQESSHDGATNENGNTTTGGQGGEPTFKLSCEEARFIHLLNLYRSANGRIALTVSQAGVVSSRWHCHDMIEKNYFSHTEPNGRAFNVRAAAFGYSAWAENIAGGYSHAVGTFCIWKNSPGHNANMLNDGHRSTGIGLVVVNQYSAYWSSNFGPAVSDSIQEPLTADSNCPMPTALPDCSGY